MPNDTGQGALPFGPGAAATRAVARRGDPETSREAARSLSTDSIRASQRRVLQLFRLYGFMTDRALAAAARAERWEVSPSGLRTRRSELVAAGLVVDTGRRVLLPSGRKAVVWGLNPNAPEAAHA